MIYLMNAYYWGLGFGNFFCSWYHLFFLLKVCRHYKAIKFNFKIGYTIGRVHMVLPQGLLKSGWQLGTPDNSTTWSLTQGSSWPNHSISYSSLGDHINLFLFFSTSWNNFFSLRDKFFPDFLRNIFKENYP